MLTYISDFTDFIELTFNIYKSINMNWIVFKFTNCAIPKLILFYKHKI